MINFDFNIFEINETKLSSNKLAITSDKKTSKKEKEFQQRNQK